MTVDKEVATCMGPDRGWVKYCVSKFKKKRVKWPLTGPDVAQRVGKGIALLFHDHGTRRG